RLCLLVLRLRLLVLRLRLLVLRLRLLVLRLRLLVLRLRLLVLRLRLSLLSRISFYSRAAILTKSRTCHYLTFAITAFHLFFPHYHIFSLAIIY
ncbi:MAG: hypothetical protein IJO48_04975, partial [Clostridia bacterium]|nr:hypothetical protein [Clostridia bacterium]